MRKDTRVGVAIGLVLFLVLIVYAIAVPKSTKKAVTLDKKGKTAAPVEGLSTNATPLKAETSANTGSAVGEQPKTDGGAGGAQLVAKDPPADNAASATNWAALLSAQDKMDSGGGLRTKTPDMAQPDGASPRTGVSHGVGEITGKTGTSKTEVLAGTHRVAENETFASIARSVYGDVKYANLIAKANPNIDPRRLRPGMTIRLPEKSATADSATLASGTVKANGSAKVVSKSDKEYTVQSNDSLYRISMKLFGRGDKADAIYELNKQTIGSDPAKLKIGMVLKVPQATTPVTTASAVR